MTTLETNIDEGYRNISKAPLPSERFRDFLDLDYPRKVVTIEPVMDFCLDGFVDWMVQLKRQDSLEYVWFGFNSKPKQVQLPEPTIEKAQTFVDKIIQNGIEVRGKSLREVRI